MGSAKANIRRVMISQKFLYQCSKMFSIYRILKFKIFLDNFILIKCNYKNSYIFFHSKWIYYHSYSSNFILFLLRNISIFFLNQLFNHALKFCQHLEILNQTYQDLHISLNELYICRVKLNFCRKSHSIIFYSLYLNLYTMN